MFWINSVFVAIIFTGVIENVLTFPKPGTHTKKKLVIRTLPEYKIIRGEQIPIDVKRHKRFHYDEINDSKGFEKDFRTFEQYSFGRHNNDNEEYRGQGLSSYEYDEFGGFKGQGASATIAVRVHLTITNSADINTLRNTSIY
ncbi:hypothetical protein Phum_PHUM425440 [Pediculus humanus corporis]|uniref:Uncharacterized protein n=1 Tax=Pediculus humanus subsp. corporis TaxID=121224 RepID=E0VT22_PEDHC|nr:uncharacterized protein Phum_PHUM425440 [Pediculus humanus corporis]EEB16528.1 hypothetical protein Phum_PHUM425440 [Pediculus humanus corporis]